MCYGHQWTKLVRVPEFDKYPIFLLGVTENQYKTLAQISIKGYNFSNAVF